MTKKLAFTRVNNQRHWVGDGFPVRSVFSYNDSGEELSPFLLLDYAGPAQFEPTDPAVHRRGVGEHPHRGFETVTIVYQGEVEHRDSSGGGGRIGPGDVQWMTAASGLVHEEFHGTDYARKGGPFEMIQLWVNLPKKDKMSSPGYQNLLTAAIPSIETETSTVRVIAGEYSAQKGPARVFSPINLWDVRLKAGSMWRAQVREGDTTAVFVMKGAVQTSREGAPTLGEGTLGVFETKGTDIEIEAAPGGEDATLLFLNGTPLGEPVVGYGPFVMNTQAEIRQAFVDFQSGKFGAFKSP